jgi:multiple antibiotic resistance protein
MVAVAIAIIVLRSAHYLAKLLGASGLAISRIVGFIVIAIGVQSLVQY